jgi:TP53 regulating kinase-like protein
MNQIPKPGDLIPTEWGEVAIETLLGKGKSGYSFRAKLADQMVVFKYMHDEPCAYYHFSDNKVCMEEKAYQRLSALGLPIPKLLGSHKDESFLIKEYLEGPTAAEWLIQGGKAREILPQLFDIAHRAEADQINLDYFPTNFCITGDRLFYIDFELNSFDPKWSLKNWGIYYWANPQGLKRYFETGDPLAINISSDSGIPLKDGFEEQVAHWLKEFSV